MEDMDTCILSMRRLQHLHQSAQRLSRILASMFALARESKHARNETNMFRADEVHTLRPME